MNGYICIKALVLGGIGYTAGSNIPAEAVLPGRVRALIKQGYISPADSQTVNVAPELPGEAVAELQQQVTQLQADADAMQTELQQVINERDELRERLMSSEAHIDPVKIIIPLTRDGGVLEVPADPESIVTFVQNLQLTAEESTKAIEAMTDDTALMSGSYPMCTIAADSAKELEDRMTIAKSFNDPKITYVLNSCVDAAGRKYEGYQIAARIGGIIASTPSNQSITHEVVTNMIDLDKPLTNTEIIRALKSGCIVLTKNDDGQVWIEQGINTLITPNAEQDEGWKKIRRVKTRFELMQRMDNTLEKIIGKINNDPDGRATVIAAGNKLIKLMWREGKLLEGGYMTEDDSNPPEGDSAWFIIAVDDVDSIEFVYLLYRYRFAPDTSE